MRIALVLFAASLAFPLVQRDARAQETPAAKEQPRLLVFKDGTELQGVVRSRDDATLLDVPQGTIVVPRERVDRVAPLKPDAAVKPRSAKVHVNSSLRYAFVVPPGISFIGKSIAPAVDFVVVHSRFGVRATLEVMPDPTPEEKRDAGTLDLAADDYQRANKELLPGFKLASKNTTRVMGQPAARMNATYSGGVGGKDKRLGARVEWKHEGLYFVLTMDGPADSPEESREFLDSVLGGMFAFEPREASLEHFPNYDFGYEVDLPGLPWLWTEERGDEGKTSSLRLSTEDTKGSLVIQVQPQREPRSSIMEGQRRLAEMQADSKGMPGFKRVMASGKTAYGIPGYQVDFQFTRDGERYIGRELLLVFDHRVYYLRSTLPESRLEFYKRDVALVYDSFALYRNLGSKAGARIAEQARERYAEGVRAQKKHENDAAMKAFEDALRLFPDYADAYKRMAEVHFSAGDNTKALRAARKARGLFREDPQLREFMAEVHLKEATRLARDKNEPKGGEMAVGNCVSCLQMSRDKKRRERAFKGIINLGRAALGRRQYDQAIDAYRAALKADRNYEPAKKGLADVYVRQSREAVKEKNFSKARSRAKKALSTYKKYKPAEQQLLNVDRQEKAEKKRRAAKRNRR